MARFGVIALLVLMIGCGKNSPPPKVADDTSGHVEADGDAGELKQTEGWLEDGDRALDSPNMKSKDGFGAQLFLIEDEQFFNDWNRPTPPKLAPVKKARRGTPIFTVLILAGMGTDSEGYANVTYDLVFANPTAASGVRKRSSSVGIANITAQLKICSLLKDSWESMSKRATPTAPIRSKRPSPIISNT